MITILGTLCDCTHLTHITVTEQSDTSTSLLDNVCFWDTERLTNQRCATRWQVNCSPCYTAAIAQKYYGNREEQGDWLTWHIFVNRFNAKWEHVTRCQVEFAPFLTTCIWRQLCKRYGKKMTSSTGTFQMRFRPIYKKGNIGIFFPREKDCLKEVIVTIIILFSKGFKNVVASVTDYSLPWNTEKGKTAIGHASYITTTGVQSWPSPLIC